MALAVVIAGLALGLIVAALTYRFARRTANPGASFGLAVTVFAVVVTLLAFPLEKAFAPLVDKTVPTGPNPSPEQPAQQPSVNEAWGPERPMFTNNLPADRPVLNSISDNPEVGDERIFLVFKDNTITDRGHWQQSGELLAGHTYLFRIYVNAAGADDLREADLYGVTARVRLPGQVGGTSETGSASAGTAQYCGFLDASNAQPPRIWSCGVFLARHEVRLFPEPASVTLYSNHFGLRTADGPLHLGAALFTDIGQPLGYTSMDGHVPAGYRYDLYVTFTVRVERN